MLALSALIIGGFALILSALNATIADVSCNVPSAWMEDVLADNKGLNGLDGIGREQWDRSLASAPGVRRAVREINIPPR